MQVHGETETVKLTELIFRTMTLQHNRTEQNNQANTHKHRDNMKEHERPKNQTPNFGALSSYIICTY